MKLGERMGPFSQLLISLLVLAAFFGTVAVLLLRPGDLTPGVRDVLLILVGVLAGAFKDVVGFYLGSSMGSQRKDATIQAQAETISPAGGPTP